MHVRKAFQKIYDEVFLDKNREHFFFGQKYEGFKKLLPMV